MVAKLDEFLRRHRLSKEIRGVIICAYERHYDFSVLNHIPNIEMASLNVFDPLVEFGIVGEIMSRLIVSGGGSGPTNV